MQLSEPVSPLERWALDPAVRHLNHGSYGGCLRRVLDDAAAWRARLEANPMQFMVVDWQPALDAARAQLAAFVGAPAERLAFVPNTTTGVAIALASTEVAAGDELLTTDHVYRACGNQLSRLAAARGARVVTVAIPLPYDAEAALAAVTKALTPRTRLALFDHISSPTALVLPIAALVARCRERGIVTIIDGAHVPGQLPLDVSAIGATWYIGNCHKWLCAPKSSGFLAAAEDVAFVPVITSHGASPEYGPANRFHAELDWAGTYDPSTHLAVPSAITQVAAEAGGWPAIFARNHALVCELRRRLLDGVRATPVAADRDLGCMAALPITLPAGVSAGDLQMRVLREGWELPIVDVPHGTFVRISAHLYNHAGEAEVLARQLHAWGVRWR